MFAYRTRLFASVSTETWAEKTVSDKLYSISKLFLQKNNSLGNKTDFVEKIRKALYASKIVSYAQGFMLLREAADNFGWKLNYGGIALMWRGGCIIRSAFLGKIK